MALNQFMHKRNLYRTKKVDFKQLSEKYEEFCKFIKEDSSGKVTIDFKDCSSLRALTTTLLKEDFSLDVDLPLDRLIPTVPLRLNYIHWIEDIIGTNLLSAKGFDIGTGACCIYPLLGHCINGWTFLASEVDETNAMYATENVHRNQLSDSITVARVSGDTVMLEALSLNNVAYDFCMCNPPFFADHMEAQAVSTSRSSDRPDPSSSNCAHPVESIVEGGEALFIRRMITESLQVKDRIRVFTSMVGKKSSLPLIKSYLRQCKVTSYGVTEFCQGRTMRWGIAWSFSHVQFPKSEFREMKQVKTPSPLVHELPCEMVRVAHDFSAVTDYIASLLSGPLHVNHTLTSSELHVKSWRLRPTEKSWTNQRRKRRQQQRSAATADITLSEVKRSAVDGATCLVSEDARHTEKKNGDNKNLRLSDNVDCMTDGYLKSVSPSLPDETANKNIQLNTMAEGSRTDMQKSINTISSPRNNTSNDSVGSERSSCLFECTLNLKKADERLVIEMIWLDGSDRNLMYELMQFFKNHLV